MNNTLKRFSLYSVLLALITACGDAGQEPPPIDLAARPALGVLIERRDELRIQLSEFLGATAFELSSPAGLRFRNSRSDIFTKYRRTTPVRIHFQRSNALVDFWRLIIAKYPIDQRIEASRHARRIQLELGVRAEVIEEPFREPWDVTRRAPEAYLAVVAGRFANEAQALQARTLIPDFAQAETFHDTHRGITGFLNVFDSQNHLIAKMLPEGEFESADGKTPIRIQPLFDPATTLPVASAAYRGKIQLLPESDQTLMPVNIVTIEDYLLSVVPSEIGDFAPEEALKTQAVAARSEAICKLNWGNRHADSRYDFVSGQQDQVYTGILEETERCTDAIHATTGQVLLHKGKIIDAVYSHSCGGRTANSEDIWGGVPIPYLKGSPDYAYWQWQTDLSALETARLYLRTPVCAYCNPRQRGFPEYAEKFYRWTKDVPLKDIATRLNDRGYAVGDLKSIRILKRAASGRIREIKIVGTARTIQLANGDTISYLLGNLYSSFFAFEGIYDKGKLTAYRFQGGGFGHGVGLCQIGAYMMAKRGYDYASILSHYFPQTQLRRLY